VNDLCCSYRCKVTVTLIGEYDLFRSCALDTCRKSRRPTMSCLAEIYVNIVVHEGCATYGSGSNNVILYPEFVDYLANQPMSDSMTTTRTVMGMDTINP